MQRRIFILIIMALGIGQLLFEESALAQGPPPDYTCRLCHRESEREVTLPSGETLSVEVTVDKLNESPHRYDPDSRPRVFCYSCHSSRSRYDYPHEPPEAETLQEYITDISEICLDCHNEFEDHRPLHETEEDNPEFPVCANCHGSHDVAPAEEIPERMPQACVSCHTDETPEWASLLLSLEPRPGFGEGAAGYVGSDTCARCHIETYASWEETPHARSIQDPSLDSGAIVADFLRTTEVITEEVSYTIGGHWKQLFVHQDEADNFQLLPFQWNVETAEWVPYPEGEEENDLRQNCGSCHLTGLDTQTWEFNEYSIGCESCHGPGEEHINDPENVKPFTEIEDQVCGSCHSRGESPDGHPFPATYRPGDDLTEHFTFAEEEANFWPNGSARIHKQQYLDWQLGSSMAASPEVQCATCHSVHDSGAEETAQLVEPLNGLCLECHNDKRAIISHTPYHDKAIQEYEFTCADCHMPTMATSAVPYDIHNHSFLQPDPEASIEHGGIALMPNACNLCHTGFGEDPQWAAETIAYVSEVVTPSAATFFGPGPTPTSPPPPTPLPSVGEPPEIVELQTGQWVRILFFLVMALVVLAVGVKIWLSISQRRSSNV